ncbi:hypothetical protein ACFQ14_01795 [Pseudahrensia aquimaris]|uniref:SnoaL-like domain-containing protein n=1 Tax=Pseudahrensia aquimaris TaxID=744461 RepID=A0ABW3FA37_9HYPH
MAQTNKPLYKHYLDAFAHPGEQQFRDAVAGFIAPDAKMNVVHPFNDMSGADYFDTFIASLLGSFDGLHRRDYLLTEGGFEGGDWVSSTGYYVGHFKRDWLGIKASDALQYLRVGEFHRIENGRSVEAYIYLDIPELMISVDQWPELESPAVVPGYTGMIPGPATSDGLDLSPRDPVLSQSSLKIVTQMLDGLATKDEAWRPFWHENMMWYGPGAFGSFIGVDNFHAFQVPFEGLFSHWIGGSKEGSETRHFTRHGDGNYVCSGGWPSLNAHQIKPFLSQPATNKTLYMRVCDWWRREDDLLVENWVFVDIPHVLLQMGYDLFAEISRQQK